MRTPSRAVFLPLLAMLLCAPLQAQDTAARERGVRHFEQQRYAEARQELAAYAAANPRDARAAFYLGLSHQRERNLDAAIEWLERAVRLDGNQAIHHLELAGALGQKAQDVNMARQAILARRIKSHLERASGLEPDNLDARMGLIQFYVMAPGVMGGSKAKAREEAAQIRQRNPYRAVFASTFIHRAEKNYAAAEAEYRAALRQYPDSSALYMGLGSIFASAEQWDRVFETIDAWLARSPGDPSALFQLGRAGALSGQQLDRAEQALRRYLTHQPSASQPPLAAAHWRLGMVLEHQRRPEPAREQYQAALRLDPRHREARAALDRLGRR
jgi:tetratricopeptide (TPR) repeat protein